MNVNHRIIESPGLEGTLKIILFQSPTKHKDNLSLDQVAQSPIQSGLEHYQELGSHSSGQPMPLFHLLHSKEFLPNIQSLSTLFHLKATKY